MKILYVVHQFYPHYGSGTEKITYNIASMIQNSGNKVKVITYRVNHDGLVNGAFENIKYYEFMYRKIPVMEFFLDNEPTNFTIDLVNEDVLEFAKEILKREKPDIVHICHPMRVGSFIQAAEAMGIPCIITATDLMYICPKIIMTTLNGELCSGPKRGLNCNLICYDTGNQNPLRMSLAEQFLSRADSIVAPSIFISNMIKNEIPEIDFHVIKHGLDYSGIKLQSKEYSSSNMINFGFVGSVQEHKGVHLLVNAFMKVNAENIRLHIFGGYEGDYGKLLTNRAKKDSRIRFYGAFESHNIDEIYRNIDVLVIPSICYESYSLVKHEAIMRNIPIIVANIGALGDGIVLGINGYKFALSESNSLYHIIEDIAHNPEQLNEIKKNLNSYVISTIEQESFQYLTLYRKCIDKQKNKNKN